MGSLGTLICLLSFTLGYFALNELTSNKNAIVLVEEVSALNSPTENAKEQFKLHEGTKVNVLEISDAYTSVQLDNGNEGWIKTSQLGLY
jgi:SH3-like domain-containing protein